MNKISDSPVIIQCPFVPQRFCVNILGTIWARDKLRIDRYLINHERIHTAQQRELLFIPFYLLYLLEWLFRLIQYRNWYRAYENISFEREAYSYGRNLDYLSRRRHYAWLHYLRHK